MPSEVFVEMNSLYNQALKQSNALRKDLDTFESQISPSTSSTDPASPTSSISLTALQGACHPCYAADDQGKFRWA